MNRIFARWGVLLICLLLLFSQTMYAQECVAQYEALMQQMSESCAGLAAESLCAVNGAELPDGSALENTVPVGSTVDFLTRSSEAGPGLALLNIGANVPAVLAAEGVRLLAIGDTHLTNTVDPAAAAAPSDVSAQVTAIVGSNLRSAPSTEARIVGNVVAGTALDAFGRSSDSQWFIILHEGSSKWISRQVIAVTGGDVDSLPVITGAERSLMQELIFRAEEGACNGVPRSMLVAQGPSGFSTLLEINGVEFRFTGSLAFWMAADNQMQMMVLDGGAVVGGLNIPAGFTMFAPVGDDGLVAGAWTGLRPINPDERGALTAVTLLPVDLLLAEMRVPSESEVNETLAGLNQGAVGQTVLGPAAAQANCRAFRPTSPLQGLQNAANAAFFWDGAPGATGYRLYIYNEGGTVAKAVEVSSLSTTLTTDTSAGAIGGGTVFSWEVQALVNGEVACTSSRVTVVRDAANQPVGNQPSGPQPTPTSCPWSGC